MDLQLTQQAIKCALEQNWKEAIHINQQLLLEKDDNVAALNRLAYAYLKSGNIATAKNTYKKVLKIDKYNPIAVKNLKWLTHLNKDDIQKDTTCSPSPTVFIEEPGKTKIVTLINPAPFKVLCNVMTTEKVNLVPKKHAVEIRDHKNVYLGALPDDLSHRLIQFILAGNLYDAYVKNVQKNVITVFIRESKRALKFKFSPSFPLTASLKRTLVVAPTETDEFSKEEEL